MEQAVRKVGIKLIASECQTDVVLSCGRRKLYAHKVMLSIASPVLHDILIDPAINQHHGIILIFADFQYEILTLILEYIYNGYVHLPNIFLKDFLDVCNLLKIKIDLKLDPLKNSISFKDELSIQHIKYYVSNKKENKLECCDKINSDKYLKSSNELSEELQLCDNKMINEQSKHNYSIEGCLRHESKMEHNSMFFKNNQINPNSALQIISTLVSRDTPYNFERFNCVSNDNSSEIAITDRNVNNKNRMATTHDTYSNNIKSKPNTENSSEKVFLINRSQSFDQTHSDTNTSECISSLNYLKRINDHHNSINHKTDSHLITNKICNKQMPELVPINNYHLNKINSSCNNSNVFRMSKLYRYNKVTPCPWTPRLLPIGSDPRATHPKYEVRRKKINQQADNELNYKKSILKQLNSPVQYNDKNNNNSSYLSISMDMSAIKNTELNYIQNNTHFENPVILETNSDTNMIFRENETVCSSTESEYRKDVHEATNSSSNTSNYSINSKEKHKLQRKHVLNKKVEIPDNDTESIKRVSTDQEHNTVETTTCAQKPLAQEIHSKNNSEDKIEEENISRNTEQQPKLNSVSTETIAVIHNRERVHNNKRLNNQNIDTSNKSDANKEEGISLICGSCGDKFTNKEMLKEHVRRHIGEKPYFCSECGKTFSQLRNYKYHRSVHEGTREFAAECPECGKHFNDRGYLSSHLKIHRNRKEYKCPHCPKRFNQRVAYNMHVRIHTGIKPHQCTVCEKSFSRKMLLRQHMRVHTGERPYSCTVCGKRFADRSNMSLHARLHTGIKPYSCTICNKSFTKKHHLKTHMNYHSGAKPYICPSCGLAFSQSSNMRTHYKKCSVISNNRPVLSQKEESTDQDNSKLKELNR